MVKYFFKITILSLIIGASTGLILFGFSRSLIFVTDLRRHYGILPYCLLPIAGMVVAFIYSKIGKDIDHGNNLILDEIHNPTKKIHFKMVPMIFLSSLISHLFGASVGREGVGVQIGAGIADQFSFIKLDRPIILMMGMSAGFAAIFHAPLAGAIFGVEIFMVGALSYEALLPCLMSASIGFYTIQLLAPSNEHLFYLEVPKYSIPNFLMVTLVGVSFGLLARLFVFSLHSLKQLFNEKIPISILRPFISGVILLGFYVFIGSDRYHGLGEEIIETALSGKHNNILPFDFLGKLFSTAITIAGGFKGGEVMPLFYIGATFGSSLSVMVPLAKTFLAALGFVSVFAGASNAPLASLILAMEFFGSDIGLYAAIAIVISFFFSGHRGIYTSQRSMYKKKI